MYSFNQYLIDDKGTKKYALQEVSPQYSRGIA